MSSVLTLLLLSLMVVMVALLLLLLVGIEDAAIGQRGSVALFDGSNNIDKPSDSADYATWLATLDDEQAMTIHATASKFVISDFSALEEA